MRAEIDELRRQHALLDDRGARFQLATAACARLQLAAATPAQLATLRDKLTDEHHAVGLNLRSVSRFG